MSSSDTPYYRTAEDYARWGSHRETILMMLFDQAGTRLPMASIKRRIDSANPSTHISALRKEGYLIECTREGMETFYTLKGYTGEDNTNGVVCPNCGHSLPVKETG